MKTFRSNRALLKGNDGVFNIKGHNTFREKPMSAYRKYRFRKATPAYMRNLREKLKADKLKARVKTISILMFSIVLVLLIIWG